jgi:hypothetical protein
MEDLEARLENSRSVVLLGESVREVLHSEAFLTEVPAGSTPEQWAAGYVDRRKQEQLTAGRPAGG